MLAHTPPRTSNSRPRSRGRAAAGDKRQSGLTITLRIYNYARVVPAELTEAENVAAVILRKARIEPAWIDCPLSEGELDAFPDCQRPLTPSQFVLRLVTQPPPNYSVAHQGEIGVALACREQDAGCSAYLSYPSVKDWAERADTAADRILGHVIVHEIGHLLLGPDSHSRSGVMRPDWDVEDLGAMARNFICFTSGQAHSVRVEVRKRSKGL